MGFPKQKALLDHLLPLLPEGCSMVLMDDLFYGTPDLINYCHALGWDWQLRLKGNVTMWVDGEKTHLSRLAEEKVQRSLKNVSITHKATTNIGMVKEKTVDHCYIRHTRLL